MRFTGGDVVQMHLAAASVRSLVAEADAQSKSASADGRQAASASGRADVSSAAESLAGALAKAIADTGAAIGELAAISGTTASGIERATGAR